FLTYSPPPPISTLSLHDALPIYAATFSAQSLSSDLDVLLELMADALVRPAFAATEVELVREQTVAQIDDDAKNTRAVAERAWREDRKSTRLNSSHVSISYAVFCL